MSGPRQHYLPAGVIGGFSSETGPSPTRDHKVWVLRRRGLLSREAARAVAFQNNLYSMGDARYDIDAYWSAAEKRISPALNDMLAGGPGRYRADPWVHVARYVASLFARSPDFHQQMNGRFANAGGLLDPYLTRVPTNGVRPLENQRVAAAVLRARWAVVRSDSHPLIISDRGMTAMSNPRWGTNGYVFQLRPNLAMMLGHGPYEKQITWLDNDWRIGIPTDSLDNARARSLNEATWLQCRREIYGGSQDELQRVRRFPPPPAAQPDIFDGACLLGLTGAQRRQDEMLLIRLLGGLNPPSDPSNPPLLKV